MPAGADALVEISGKVALGPRGRSVSRCSVAVWRKTGGTRFPRHDTTFGQDGWGLTVAEENCPAVEPRQATFSPFRATNSSVVSLRRTSGFYDADVDVATI